VHHLKCLQNISTVVRDSFWILFVLTGLMEHDAFARGDSQICDAFRLAILLIVFFEESQSFLVAKETLSPRYYKYVSIGRVVRTVRFFNELFQLVYQARSDIF
jgi:hypothetical protein